jgi:rfaE bifunctional protein kinase chain/domain
MSHLDDLVGRFADRRIAVVGDVMLDHFLVGRVDRISPEAPVPVVRFDRDDFRLGGAANVAHNVARLGARVSLVGLVGEDEAASRLRNQLSAGGLDPAGLVTDPGRPTTRKMRIVTTRNQQVARVDHESEADPAGSVLEVLVRHARAAVAEADAVVLSDYRKGVVTPAVIEACLSAAREAGIPLLVDPKVPQADRYRGATLITPNHHEAELMTQMSIRSDEDARSAAAALHERTGASVLITWGEYGMWVLDTSASPRIELRLPAAAREVSDVTGAGDTVIAVLALGLGAGARLTDAARLANLAAGFVVAHFGPAAPSAADLRATLAVAPSQ